MKNQVTISSNLKNLYRQNARLIKRFDPAQSRGVLDQLRQLTLTFGFSVALNDLLRLDSGWYVTHSGLVRLASRRHCAGIQVEQVDHACDPQSGRWVFKGTVYKTRSSKGFSGYGDADPSNVSSLVRGAEMRVAETR